MIVKDLDAAEIVRLYKSGLSSTVIAGRLGCNCHTVICRLREAGVAIRPAGKPTLPIDIAEITRLYGGGLGVERIAHRIGCSPGTIIRRLREAGVVMRGPCGREGAPLNDAEIIRLYNAGHAAAAIAQRFGCAHQSIEARLHKAGVTLRAPGTWSPARAGRTEAERIFADENAAKRQGREAADRNDPISSYPPNAPLWFVAAWKTGWTERREAIREERDEQWRREQERLPPGGKRSTQIGQRMSRETARARLGEAFA